MKPVGPGYGWLRTLGAIILPAGVVVGGFFQPLVGLAVPLLVIVAAGGSLSRRRWFCTKACPRGALLGMLGPRFSLRRPLPAFMRGGKIRTALCGILLICTAAQASRSWNEWGQLGRFFWLVCALSLAASFLLSFLFSPRSWCAVCPVGALQDTIALRGRGRK